MHSHLFSSASAASAFILAGHSIFTLVSKKSGARFTFKVSKKKGAAAADPFFVSLLTGPENASDYSYLGTIFPMDRVLTGSSPIGPAYGNRPAAAPKYVHGKKSRVAADAPSARAFAWAWERIAAGQLPETLEVWHEGRCGKCGRRLTDPTSIASGLGPVCEDASSAAA